jgi:hypothetical protein
MIQRMGSRRSATAVTKQLEINLIYTERPLQKSILLQLQPAECLLVGG